MGTWLGHSASQLYSKWNVDPKYCRFSQYEYRIPNTQHKRHLWKVQFKQHHNRKLDIVNVSRDECSENVWNNYLLITDVIN